MQHDASSVPLREFFETLLDAKVRPLDDKADKIIELQEAANSRLRKAETAIAVLKAAYGLGVVVIGWLVLEMVKK